MKFRGGSKVEKIAPQMAPMIDVVFQLLIFFMLTLKIVSPEGEFGINMPLTGQSPENPDEPLLPEMKVRAIAGADGELASLQLNGRDLGNDEQAFADLTASVRRLAGDPSSDEPSDKLSVEIDPDYKLNYRWFIKTVGAVSGDRLPDGTTVPLVQNIKFAQARPNR
jgi:biopolymer transport protein ExbD